MLCEQSAAGPNPKRTPCAVMGNTKVCDFLKVCAANLAQAGGMIGSFSPDKIRVGMWLTTGRFSIAAAGLAPQAAQVAKVEYVGISLNASRKRRHRPSQRLAGN